MKIYTNEYHVDFARKCISNPVYISQFLNDNLIVPTRSNYKSAECWPNKLNHSLTIKCTGRMTIQDYDPRNYYMAFGFACDEFTSDKKVNGLTFNVSLSDQTNITTCVGDAEIVEECQKFYNNTSFPSLLGHSDPYEISAIVPFIKASIFLYSKNKNLSFAETDPINCHQNLLESMCYALYPKCQPESQEVTYWCKEMCQEILIACWNISFPLLSILSRATAISLKPIQDDFPNIQEICEYLPSFYTNNTRCFYKAAECTTPPQVAHAMLVNQNQSGNFSFPMHSVVEYSCDSKFELKGDPVVSCLYSGKWSELPHCEEKKSIPPMVLMSLSIICALLVFFGFVVWLLNKKRANWPKRRNKTYDALVCCSVDGQEAFVANTILPEFEDNQNPPFRLCYHDRDFRLGKNILENIQNAIENSNSAIFLICQRFIDSRWCMQELRRCYEESKKDPDFRLFLIMMEPFNTFENVPKLLKTCIQEKTYGDVKNPQTLKTIADYLRSLRQKCEDETDALPVEEETLFLGWTPQGT